MEKLQYTVSELNLYVISMDEFHTHEVDEKKQVIKNTCSMTPFI